MAHKVMSEAFAEGDMTKAEAIVRKLFDLAMESSVPALKLLLDREWPAPTRHEISGDLRVSAIQQQIEDAAEELDRLIAPHRDPRRRAEHSGAGGPPRAPES